MEKNFHYHVTYSAARFAGAGEEAAQKIARAARFVDEHTEGDMATCQTTTEIAFANFSPNANEQLRKLYRIWPVFHFLPGDIATFLGDVCTELYDSQAKYLPLICMPNGVVSREVISRTKAQANPNNGSPDDLPADALFQIGIAMHVIADTFAHQRFAGVPCKPLNEVDFVYVDEHYRDILDKAKWSFTGNKVDSMGETARYAYAPAGFSENSFGYLGHGRAGHMPDIPGLVFGYKPKWQRGEGQLEAVYRSNPLEFLRAYAQMVKDMEYIFHKTDSSNEALDADELLRPYYSDADGFQEGAMHLFAKMKSDDYLPDVWRAAHPITAHLEPGYKSADTYMPLIGDELGPYIAAAGRHSENVISFYSPLENLLQA